MFGQIPYHLIESGQTPRHRLGQSGGYRGPSHGFQQQTPVAAIEDCHGASEPSGKAGKGWKMLEGLPKSQVENCHQSHNYDTPKHLEYLRVYW